LLDMLQSNVAGSQRQGSEIDPEHVYSDGSSIRKNAKSSEIGIELTPLSAKGEAALSTRD
jgi:hypothetical protein